MWENDGAVPVTSSTGRDLIRAGHVFYLGDIDHEEYFGAPADAAPLGRLPTKVTPRARRPRQTLDLLGYGGLAYLTTVSLPDTGYLRIPDCHCAEVTVETPSAGQQLAAGYRPRCDGGTGLAWRPVRPIHPYLAARVRDAVAGIDIVIDGATTQRTDDAGPMAPDLTYRLPLDITKIAPGTHDLTVRVRLRASTEIVSETGPHPRSAQRPRRARVSRRNRLTTRPG